MTVRQGVTYGARCYRARPDGGVCMRPTSGGPCIAHAPKPVETEPTPVRPCAIASCPLPALEGGRYCRGHARVMGS